MHRRCYLEFGLQERKTVRAYLLLILLLRIYSHNNSYSWHLIRIWKFKGDVWKPLRKIDCKALNESRGEFTI